MISTFDFHSSALPFHVVPKMSGNKLPPKRIWKANGSYEGEIFWESPEDTEILIAIMEMRNRASTGVGQRGMKFRRALQEGKLEGSWSANSNGIIRVPSRNQSSTLPPLALTHSPGTPTLYQQRTSGLYVVPPQCNNLNPNSEADRKIN